MARKPDDLGAAGDDPKNPAGIDAVDWREVSALIIAGGIGGFLAWVSAGFIGSSMPFGPILAIPGSIVLGMGAAIIGVYLIAHSDTRLFMRCLAFAMMCGFCWKPIYDAGSAAIAQSIGKARAAEQTEALAGLSAAQTALASTPAGQVNVAMANLSDAAARLVNSVNEGDAASRVVAEVKLREMIAAISGRASEAPVTAAETLARVGAISLASDLPQITAASVKSLSDIIINTKDDSKAIEVLQIMQPLVTASEFQIVSPQIKGAMVLDRANAEQKLDSRIKTTPSDPTVTARLRLDYREMIKGLEKQKSNFTQFNDGNNVKYIDDLLKTAHASLELEKNNKR